MYPHGLAVADFNLDGKTDLLVSKGSSATVSVLTNTTTSGTVSFAAPLEFAAAGNNHEGAATGDLDGDGKLDFVVTYSTGISSVSVFIADMNGSLVLSAKGIRSGRAINLTTLAAGTYFVKMYGQIKS